MPKKNISKDKLKKVNGGTGENTATQINTDSLDRLKDPKATRWIPRPKQTGSDPDAKF